MKFCPECGNNVEGMKFCSNCGKPVSTAEFTPTQEIQSEQENERILLEFSTYMFGLEGQKAGFVNVPTYNYTLTTERLLIEKQGVITSKKDELELYKVKDIIVHQKLKDKMMKIGDIEIISADESTPKLMLRRIKEPYEVKEVIRAAVKTARKAAGVSIRQEI